MGQTVLQKPLFETELDYFIQHQGELVKQYGGKVLIIRGETLESVHDTALDAFLEGNRRFGRGNFMIQECIAGPDAYTVSIPSLDLDG